LISKETSRAAQKLRHLEWFKKGSFRIQRRIYMQSILKSIGAILICTASVATHAVSVDVFAAANSSSGGVGADTGLDIGIGDSFSITAALDDCWSAGGGARTSNADGLVGIGGACQPSADFGLWSQDGLSAPFGSLVGRLGAAGSFFVVGTDFAATASETGRLFLYYWDSNSGDNSGLVTANVTVRDGGVVPEPTTLGMLCLGLLAVGARSRRAAA
jgi:PEP-CTERM motif